MTYVPLHVHSDSSLLDGLSKPSQIAKRCREIGISACAITNHGVLSDCVQFSTTMKKAGIKFILGVEAYITPGKITDKLDRTLHHLVILAKNKQGWKQLLGLVSESNKPEHFYYKPRLDLATLAKFADGNLIAFSGHMGSHVANALFSDSRLAYSLQTEDEARKLVDGNTIKDAIEVANQLRHIFGKENFFLEVQLIDIKRSPVAGLICKGVRYISSQLDIPCIGTPDAHYAYPEDADDQRVLLCTNIRTTFKEVRQKMIGDEDVGLASFFRSNAFCIPDFETMAELHKGYEHELENTLKIADMCEDYEITRSPQLPKFPTPNGESAEEYLRTLCRIGWKNCEAEILEHIQEKGLTQDDYRERFALELKELGEAGLEDYFLIVDDIVRWAKDNGQIVGPGRGSASGSLILYLLGVTQVDPLYYDLLWQRFWNASRKGSMPDIDSDFQIRQRGSIIDYIKNKYGHDKVGQMITFTRMQGRSALKDVLRVHSACTFEEMNMITEWIPDEAEISDKLQEMREADKAAGGDGEASIIRWALENHVDELREWCYLDDSGRCQGPLAKFFEMSIRIEGTKRGASKHAAGIIISNEPLADLCPMVYDKTSKDEQICGMEYTTLESMGLIKIDVLGVACLDKLQIIQDLVNARK